MIYLFCNAGFGATIERRVVQWAESRGEGLRIVHSASKLRSQRLRRRVLERARWWTRNVFHHFPLGRRSDRRLVEDVNAPHFIRNIQTGDHAVVAGFDQIFRSPTIERFATIVNVHPSLLPLYRGPVPSYWCLQNGESASGYSIHRLTARVDAGDVLMQGVVPIQAGDTPHSLDARIAQHAADAIVLYLDGLLLASEPPRTHVDARAVYRTHVNYLSFPKPPAPPESSQ
jgi:folate-dependent phosphoribosylglycinamide formyltransferase PurN